MPPIRERIIRRLVGQALLLFTLILVVAFPCFSQRHMRFVKRASLPAFPVSALSVQDAGQPKTVMGGERVCVSTARKPSYALSASVVISVS